MISFLSGARSHHPLALSNKLRHLLTGLKGRAAKEAARPLPTPPSYQGYVDAISERHVVGWLWNMADPDERVSYQVVVETTGEVLSEDRAAGYLPGLRQLGVGDGAHGFNTRLPRRLTPGEADALIVRPVPGGRALERGGFFATDYQPIQHIIMDLVDNCNLRCPFCLYDYSTTHKTNFMTEAVFSEAIKLAPFVTEGNFWLSCLHEPTLHPRLAEFVEQVPQAYRSKLFYTTNLAKRMPASYFEMLANSGMHHVNISIESTVPAVYEKMRKGARFRIFKENWDCLVDAFGRGTALPKLRYISLAYKSTVRDLPNLIDYLLEERCGSLVEVRHTYDEPHISRRFRQEEYLGRDDWLWLRDRLAHYPADKVMLVLPHGVDDPAFDEHASARSDSIASMYEASGPAPPAIQAEAPEPFRGKLPPGFLSGQYGLRVFLDGRLEVNAVWGDNERPAPGELRLLTTNVMNIRDIDELLDVLQA